MRLTDQQIFEVKQQLKDKGTPLAFIGREEGIKLPHFSAWFRGVSNATVQAALVKYLGYDPREKYAARPPDGAAGATPPTKDGARA